MLKTISAFAYYLKSRHGATAIEYSLIAAGIALAIVTIVFLFGGDLLGHYQTVHDSFADGGAP